MVTRLRRARCCVLDSRPQTTATVVEIAPTYPHGAHAPKLKLQVAATTRSLTRRRRRKARAAGRRRPSLRMPLRRRHRCLWTRTPPRRRTPPPVTSLMTPSGQGGGLVPRPPSHPALVRDVREQARAREQAPRQEARKTLDRPIVHRMRSVNFRVGWQHFWLRRDQQQRLLSCAFDRPKSCAGSVNCQVRTAEKEARSKPKS